MRTTSIALVCAALVGCGGDGGGTIDAPKAPDAKEFRDGPPTNNETVTISGQASSRDINGGTLLPGVTIVAYRNADENTPIAMTSTDAAGNYTLTIQTMGESIDGFLKATKQGYKDTYLYPPYPIGMDFNMATIIMITDATWMDLDSFARGNQQAGSGIIALVVTDGMNPVGGASVTCMPPGDPIRYNDIAGTIVFPSYTATMTYTDGIAYVFNVPVDQFVMVGASTTAMPYTSHKAKAWADNLSTTVIVP